MLIRSIHPADLPALYDVMSRFAAGLPHGFPIGREAFYRSFTGQPAHLRISAAFVAEDAGLPVGFARAGLYRSVGDRWSFAKHGEGLVFGPFVDQDRSAEAAGLIREALRFVASHHAERCFAFDPIESVGFPSFNGGWSGLSERRPNTVNALADFGFRLRYRELCLLRPSMSGLPAPHPAPSPLTLSYETRDGHRLSVKLYDRGVYAGACHYSRMYPRRAGDSEAMERGYIDGLAIPEDYQGRGLGRLLLLHGLQRLVELGCSSVALTTAADNYKAQNLYFSTGFRVADSCVTLGRRLDGDIVHGRPLEP